MRKNKGEIVLNIKESDLTLYIYKIEGMRFINIMDIVFFLKEKYPTIKYSIYGIFICVWNKININEFHIYEKKATLILMNKKVLKKYDYIKNILLERLIINTITNNDLNNWKSIKRNILITIKGNIINVDNNYLEVYKKLIIKCKINDNGYISIHFDYSLLIVSLENLSQKRNISKNTKIIDMVSYDRLIYENNSQYNNADIIPHLKDNIKTYIEKKGINKFVQYNINKDNSISSNIHKINDSDKLIIAKYYTLCNNKDQKTYLFIKQLIRLDMNNYKFKKNFNEKYNTNDATYDLKLLLNNIKLGNTSIKFNDICFNKNIYCFLNQNNIKSVLFLIITFIMFKSIFLYIAYVKLLNFHLFADDKNK